jgi:hypothetical protein
MLRDGQFRKSDHSGTHGCVEVAADKIGVQVRDSKNRDGAVLSLTDHKWRVFTQAVKNGQFGLPS